ncbi:MAG: hypothetical protein HN352_16895 [Bacteroidetes bacterium]|jgi:hypothetical protein|nr:hypothetical protein [Bacteroidota bacterium]MBT4410412.1 hypothetical protein [Bacteroidota bacterium]MBT7464013.1 hypothetical protein [Bacteroidota bacterium]
MNALSIEYRPIPWIRISRKAELTHPDSWGELTSEQLILASEILKGTLSDDRVIQVMTSLPKKVIRRLRPYQKLRVIELLIFLNDFTPYHEFIIPKIAFLSRPKPRLKDEYFGTFIFAEAHFSRYEKSGDLKDLDKMIACYYRTRAFREEDIEINAHALRNVDSTIKEAIYLNYILIREYLAKTYPHVFTPSSEQDQKQNSSWLDVFDAIVGEDLVQQDNYAKLPLSTVLRFLDKQIVKNNTREK